MIFLISQYLNLNNRLYYLEREKKSITSLNHLFVYCYKYGEPTIWSHTHTLNLRVTPLHDALQSGPKFGLYIKLFFNIERIIICYFAFSVDTGLFRRWSEVSESAANSSTISSSPMFIWLWTATFFETTTCKPLW